MVSPEPLEPLFDPAEIKRRCQELESASPEGVLAFALASYPKVAISTAFGVEGCALIDMATRIKPDIVVFTIDTDYLFPETLELKQRMIERYRLNVTVLKSQLTIEQQTARYGLNLYESNPDQCCALRKVEPARRAVQGLDAWIAGLRRDQAATRSAISVLELYEHEDGRPYVKVNPFCNWTRNDIWRYVVKHGVPYNMLYDRGYKSISCWPCTRPVDVDAPERAGRWAGFGKTECGIHSFAPKKA
jgi:phosphoadenosine phosphosulfate reductase